MHRSEYMSAASSSEAYRAYYGQFVSAEIRTLVLNHIGLITIRNSTDFHFNDIPLTHWDRMVPCLPASVPVLLKARGDNLTLGVGVCILKEAARQIYESSVMPPENTTPESQATAPASAHRDFNGALTAWLAAAQAIITEQMQRLYPSLRPTRLELDVPGPKYQRVISIDSGSSRSCFAFIDRVTGDVLKPESWKRPAKHARANIFRLEQGTGTGPYGCVYLK